jgi:hypothetical protein
MSNCLTLVLKYGLFIEKVRLSIYRSPYRSGSSDPVAVSLEYLIILTLSEPREDSSMLAGVRIKEPRGMTHTQGEQGVANVTSRNGSHCL